MEQTDQQSELEVDQDSWCRSILVHRETQL